MWEATPVAARRWVLRTSATGVVSHVFLAPASCAVRLSVERKRARAQATSPEVWDGGSPAIRRETTMIDRHLQTGNRPAARRLTVGLAGLRSLALLALVVGLVAPALAQQRPHHYFHSADMPPGSVGWGQLMRGGPLPGYYQPVRISAPDGTRISLAVSGVFESPRPAPMTAGMLVGRVYRIKVTGIPFREGQEVFPSIEIINRLYPPAGQEARFPIPIELTREELEMALRGQFVTRVVYLEDPRTALPRREDPKHQRYFQVGPSQDPLEVADSLGRPMAILRLGSRTPELDPSTGKFLFDSPPWTQLLPDEKPNPGTVQKATHVVAERLPSGHEHTPEPTSVQGAGEKTR